MSQKNIKTVADHKIKVKPWKANKTRGFQSNIDINKVRDLEQKLENVRQEINLDENMILSF